MAQSFGLRQSGKSDPGFALEGAEARREIRRRRDVDAGHLRPADLEDERFLDVERAIPRERVGGNRAAELGRAGLPVHRNTSRKAAA